MNEGDHLGLWMGGDECVRREGLAPWRIDAHDVGPTARGHVAHPLAEQAIDGDVCHQVMGELPLAPHTGDRIFARLVNRCRVRIRFDRLLLNHVNGPLVGHLVADTVAAYNVGPETRDLSRLRPGLHVQMIGAWHPDTNEIDIARIYAPI